MNSRGRNRINDIFPILLFLVFTLIALGIVMMSVQIYRKILERSDGNYDNKTAVMYLSEKFRSHDRDGRIRVGQFKGQDAILITSPVKDEVFVTCIYAYDGYLRELYLEEELLEEAGKDSGTEILEMESFSAKELSDRLISLEFTDRSGNSLTTCLAVKSGGSA